MVTAIAGQSGFAVIQNLAAQSMMTHLLRLPPEQLLVPGVVDRVVEPLMPFAAHSPPRRSIVRDDVENFKLILRASGPDSNEARVAANQIGNALSIVFECDEPDLAMIRAVEACGMINDGVVFRERLLTEQTGVRTRVLTNWGDLGTMILSGYKCGEIRLDYVLVEVGEKTALYEVRVQPETAEEESLCAPLPGEKFLIGGTLVFHDEEVTVTRLKAALLPYGLSSGAELEIFREKFGTAITLK